MYDDSFSTLVELKDVMSDDLDDGGDTEVWICVR